MIVKHEKTETLVIEMDTAALGPIRVIALGNGGVSFCFRDGSWLWAMPDDEIGAPPRLGFQRPYKALTGRSQ